MHWIKHCKHSPMYSGLLLSIFVHGLVLMHWPQTDRTSATTAQARVLHAQLTFLRTPITAYSEKRISAAQAVDVPAKILAQTSRHLIKTTHERKLNHINTEFIAPERPVTPAITATADTQIALVSTSAPNLKMSGTVSSAHVEEPRSQSDAQRSAQRETDNKQLLRLLHSAIDLNKRYPASARRMSREGTVQVGFRLQPDGVVDTLKVADSSGNRVLDRAALQAVRSIHPFTPAIRYMTQARTFQVAIVFRAY